jgi:hypothetical protein
LLRTMILLISATWVATIIGMSHRCWQIGYFLSQARPVSTTCGLILVSDPANRIRGHLPFSPNLPHPGPF